MTLPSEVDGIFIGGGHNSLVAATYLARAGVRVLVLEATDRLGGGMRTVEATLPLFHHNIHAQFIRWQPDNPVWRDLRIDRFGVKTIFPEVQDAVVFNERSALLHFKDLRRSLDAIARISPRDATAFEDRYEECLRLSQAIIGPLRFAAPLNPEEEDELLGRSPLGRRYRDASRRSAVELISEWFESEPVRLLVGFNVAVRGYQPVMDLAGTGHSAVVSLPAASQAQLIVGGSANVAGGLAAALYDAGGRAMTNARVSAIRIVDGRSDGVNLEDGRSIKARRFVASSIPAPLTLLDLVGRSHLDASLVSDLEAYRWNDDYSLYGFHMALRERPRFTLEDAFPELPFAYDIALGYDRLEDLMAEIVDVRMGRVGPFRVQTTIPSIHDPTQSPPGHHVAFGWKVVPPELRDDGLAERMVQSYAGFAPNVPASLLAVTGYGPRDIAAELPSMPGGDHLHGSFHPENYGYRRPHPSLSNFRTPVQGLYLCGSSQHPGGGFSGAPGFIAAGVIADDLNVPVWWQRSTARELLKALDE